MNQRGKYNKNGKLPGFTRLEKGNGH